MSPLARWCSANQPKLSNTVIVAVVAAAVVLFLAFGSLLAMLLPLITAVIGLGCGLMAVGLLSHAMSVASLAPASPSRRTSPQPRISSAPRTSPSNLPQG